MVDSQLLIYPRTPLGVPERLVRGGVAHLGAPPVTVGRTSVINVVLPIAPASATTSVRFYCRCSNTKTSILLLFTVFLQQMRSAIPGRTNLGGYIRSGVRCPGPEDVG